MSAPTEAQKAKARELVHRNVQCSWTVRHDERAADVCMCSTHHNARTEIAQALADEAERAVHAEREACAMVCIKHASRWDGGDPGGCEHEVLRGAADAIRSRGTP